MGLTRRRLLVGAFALPAVVACQAAASRVATLIRAIRPTGGGTTADQCAACGSRDHDMLDARCPSAPRVLG